MLDKILVPVDSITYDNTLWAVEEAIEFAAGCKINGPPEIIFLHVWNVESSRISMAEKEKLKKIRQREMGEEFEEIEKMCEERNVSNYKTVFKKGGAAHKEIVETAQEKDIDLIVMGSGKLHDRTARGRIEKFVYGSVAEKVVHETPCSILVARPKEEE